MIRRPSQGAEIRFRLDRNFAPPTLYSLAMRHPWQCPTLRIPTLRICREAGPARAFPVCTLRITSRRSSQGRAFPR